MYHCRAADAKEAEAWGAAIQKHVPPKKRSANKSEEKVGVPWMIEGAWLDGHPPAPLRTVADVGILDVASAHEAHVRLADGTTLSAEGLAPGVSVEVATAGDSRLVANLERVGGAARTRRAVRPPPPSRRVFSLRAAWRAVPIRAPGLDGIPQVVAPPPPPPARPAPPLLAAALALVLGPRLLPSADAAACMLAAAALALYALDRLRSAGVEPKRARRAGTVDAASAGQTERGDGRGRSAPLA